MITIISGTNRKDSLTKVFAEKYSKLISEKTNEEVRFLALEDISHDWFSPQMYQGDDLPKSLIELQEKYIFPASSFIIFAPEYNGSFPGVLKMLIDSCSVRQYTENFKSKKIGFIGIAAGRAGNLRGMGHLASIFNHQGAITYPNQLPLSGVKGLVNKQGKVTDEGALGAMTAHAEGFVAFLK